MFVDCVWNVMAHVQKPDFVFLRNGRVHLNRQGRQFSRLLAAEVCASAVVMLDTPCSEVVWGYWLPTPFASFPFTSPPLRHRVPSRFNWTLPSNDKAGYCMRWIDKNLEKSGHEAVADWIRFLLNTNRERGRYENTFGGILVTLGSKLCLELVIFILVVFPTHSKSFHR